MAKLVVKKGRNEGAEFKLNADRLIMGRRSACPIPVLDPKASREHAVVTQKDGKFFLQDLSRNGTLVNASPASKNGEGPTPLTYGDKIRVGETILEMVDESKESIDIEVPGYKFIEKIGFGGMGTVYKAKQLSMDRIVALKVLNQKYSANREWVDRFIREARAAGRLNHPNVIHIHDVSKASGRHYFSMEYIDGHSVKELLRIKGKISPERTLDIGLQTAKALEFAHESGIVHRDIKPDNIMLTTDSVVKIADLGIAKLAEEEGGATRDNRKVIGTPHYMAPEQALGKDIDYRVDIYALGATLYHMLTGTTPFSGHTAHEVLRAHIKDSLPAIQEFSKNVPDTLCFIIERMMAKLPEKRYANMTRLIEDLERVKQGIDDGIERIDAGDSTIMRAMGTEDAQEAKERYATQDARTGIQTPVTVVFLYSVLAGIFIFLVAAAVWMWTRPGDEEKPDDGPTVEAPPDEQPTTPDEPDAAKQRAEAVAKRIAEAKSLLTTDPMSSEAEGILRKIIDSYPTLSDEAKELRNGILKARSDAVLAKAQKVFDEAQTFENGNRGDPGKVAEKWQSILTQIRNVPELYKKAKAKAEDWQTRHKNAQLRTISEAWNAARESAEKLAADRDFDQARQVLKDFIGRYAGAAQKADAQQKVNEINGRAVEAFSSAQRDADAKLKDPARPIPLALEVWKRYLDSVKDTQHRAKAEKAVTNIGSQAERVIQQTAGKTNALAKDFEYESALRMQRRLVQRLDGTEWAARVRGREAELVLQSNLHKKFLSKLASRVRTGPIALPFKPNFPQWKHVKNWQIGSAQGDNLVFEPTEGQKLGLPKKLSALNVREQYQIYNLVLAPLAAEDHKAMAVFCKERGLIQESNQHSQKAAAKP